MGDRLHRIGDLRQAGLVFVVVKFRDRHIGGEHAFVYRQCHDRGQHLQQFAVFGCEDLLHGSTKGAITGIYHRYG